MWSIFRALTSIILVKIVVSSGEDSKKVLKMKKFDEDLAIKELKSVSFGN